jgi:hypothetical protein
VDENNFLWAYYPFNNRQSCTVNFVEKNSPFGGKQWDKYEVTSLYFPEVYTVSYHKVEKLCREIGDRPVTDDEALAALLRNALLAFTVRHIMDDVICHSLNMTILRMKTTTGINGKHQNKDGLIHANVTGPPGLL